MPCLRAVIKTFRGLALVSAILAGESIVWAKTNTIESGKDIDSLESTVMESTIAPMAPTGKPSTRKEIRKQWQALLNQTLPLATAQLQTRGSFYPFAAVQFGDGQIKVITTQDRAPTQSPEAGLAALRKELATLARNGRLQTVVYYADAAVTRKDTGLRQAGIRLKLDHASGESMEGFVPYVRDESSAVKLLTPEYRPSKNVTFQ